MISSLMLLGAVVLQAQEAEFSQENAAAVHQVLSVEIGPRPMGSPAEQRALRFAVEKFHAYGCDTAYLLPMHRTSRANTSSGVAVGIKRGATKRTIVIGGHIDSSGPEVPGADDNASGSAVVIELARVFGQRSMESTLVFACFGGEEQGLEGSRFFVGNFPDIDSVVLMLNIDMANGLGILDVDGDAQGISAPSWLVCAAFDEAQNLARAGRPGYENLRYPTHFFTLNYLGYGSSGSDHEPFLLAGIPAIDFSTDVNRPIHTPQDRIENFDPRGLKRSGDLVVRLVERFDAGVPNKDLQQYWLYVIGGVRIFVPYGFIDLFLILTGLCTVIAFVIVRKKRIIPLDVRWSAWKLMLYTVIVVASAWLSSDVIGFLKGVRYPWISDLTLYYWHAGIFAALGLWVSLQLTRKFPLSLSSYVYYKRAVVILVGLIVLARMAGPELALYPASTLFLITIALLLRNKLLKILLAVVSPWGMLRLIFSEWDHLVFRSVAASGVEITTTFFGLLYNIGMILFSSLYVYPLVLGLFAVYRDAKISPSLATFYRSRGVGLSLTALGVISTIYLVFRPSFSDLWQRTVYVEHTYPDSLNAPSFAILRSNDYLDGVRIKQPYGDTLISGRITHARIPVLDSDLWLPLPYSPSYRTVNEQKDITANSDTTTFTISYTGVFDGCPYVATISYQSPGKELFDFSSPLQFTTAGDMKILRWYSFPDTLQVSARFRIAGTDSVIEKTEWTHDRFIPPWHFERERTNFIKRTRFSQTRVYKP